MEALEFGRTGELVVAGELEARGWFVIPSYDYTGADGDKAPKMRRCGDAVVVPDLDVCRRGDRKWVEVKTKTEPTLHRKTQTLEHGIDAHHWEQYGRVQTESGCNVFLCVLERSSGQVLIASIDGLRSKLRRGTGAGSCMVYFPRTAFRVLFTLTTEAT